MPSRMLIAEDVFLETQRFLRARGRQGKEGLVLWAGLKADHSSAVFHCVKAGDRWAHGVKLGFDQLMRLTQHLGEQGLVLLAQVHNHPGRIPHSEGDERNPVSHAAGYLSIVVPELGLEGIDLAACYAYEYVGRLEWRALDLEEKTETLHVTRRSMKL